MRARFVVLFVVVSAALVACGGKNFESICDNQVPAPAECMTQCDPAPGAPSSCPGGYHCAGDGFCDAQCTLGGSECGDGYRCTSDGRCVGNDDCVGIECNIVDCAAQGKPPTSISGTVFAPNGTLPLFGVTAYVPLDFPLAPFPDGLTCARCDDPLPGGPITSVQSDDAGHFTITGVPSGTNVPLILTIGKFRRQITIPQVAECQDNALSGDVTRLPKNQSEGDIPKIAISTGEADALECLLRKVGIDDAEIGNAGDTHRIHLYSDRNSGNGQGTNSFQGGFPGGSGEFADATTLWDTIDSMKTYDVVIFSCEGDQHPETKSQDAMDAVKAYADLGGRLFMSHWHNVWIEGSTKGGGNQRPAVWTDIATWNDSNTTFDNPPDTIDEINNPKGMSFASWMLNVQGSPARDVIPIQSQTGKQTATSVDNAKAERWVFWENNGQFPQMFQFTTPNEAPIENRCGKVVFTDMHVSGDSDSNPTKPYPMGCQNLDLTPQEKALAFMFFDINSCIGQIF